VITNNHFRGQAVVNAIEIKAALKEELVPAPEPLFKVYPRLTESATPEEGESDLLFECWLNRFYKISRMNKTKSCSS